MKIGILGAGAVGQAFAELALNRGFEVMISNSRGLETLGELAESIGCKIGTKEEAAAFGEIILLAIPLKAYRTIPVELLAGKIVLDATNYFPARDGPMEIFDQGLMSTSELIANHLSLSCVVKGFSAIPMKELAKDAQSTGSLLRRALPIAGDDLDAKQKVMRLHDQLGFDVLDTGSLADSWRFERGRPAFCVFFQLAGLEKVLADTPKILVSH
ncbi:NAD(P)-binding domain-containing protein [Pseudomonas sp. UYIF39]|uniref:NADPH-dependent F420 reductase n=1 Tax=unclassified Pseudomonas TaxID=196821 RepID=UPI001C57158B|nr:MULTISPECIES: NAD(P)-binding domain-containing protein [unclassified Pseudomonas]MDI3357961.1 NAD(P)-binding domain-containing protein [Pseudomonas sp. UYIF39]